MAARLDLLRLGGLRVRLVLLFGAILIAVLLVFSGTVYLAAVAAEAAEDEPEAEKERELRAVRERIAASLLAALPLALVAAAGGAHLVGRRAFSVLGEIVRTASTLSLERLDLRIPNDPAAGREVEELVHALNSMLTRIEHAASGLRRFTADAAHELRTPLAVLCSEIEICLRRPRDEAALRTTLAATLEGLGRLNQLIEVLLTLARADAGALAIRPQSVDLRELITQIAEPYTAVAAERGLRLILNTSAGRASCTDPLLLGRALANLIDNACKFCAPDGLIEVRLDEQGAPGIVVSDSGPGPKSAELARAGERFYRAPEHRGSTPGFGLGLSVCHEFMAALGGTLSLRHTEDGGTEARLSLPETVPETVTGTVSVSV